MLFDFGGKGLIWLTLDDFRGMNPMVLEHAEYGDTDMKMNKFLTVLALAVGCMVSASAGTITIVNGDNDVEAGYTPGFAPASMPGGGHPINGFDIIGGQPGARIFSAPYHQSASDSTVVQNRSLTMLGLSGGIVPTDRLSNPAAVHELMQSNLLLQDGVATAFHSWVGKTNISTLQYGHRFNFSLCGTGRVSTYWNRITAVNSTNYSSAFFPVGTNGSGTEINFGPNFMALNPGPNGVSDSSPDPVTGVYTRGGDDILYSSGSPSDPSKNYTVWWRLGAVGGIGINSPSGFDPLRREFAGQGTNLVIRSELGMFDSQSNFVVVASHEVVAATAKIMAVNDSNSARLQVVGGQDLLRYSFEMKPSVGGTWSPLNGGSLHLSGVPFITPNDGGEAYFRCRHHP